MVFGSVVYLGVQIRHSSRISENEAYSRAIDTWNVFLRDMAVAKNAEVVLQGLQSYDNLEPIDKFRFDSLMHFLINTVEGSFSSVDSEFITDDVADATKQYLNRYFAYPGMFEWWQQSRTEFTVHARELIDRLYPKLESKLDYWGIR